MEAVRSNCPRETLAPAQVLQSHLRQATRDLHHRLDQHPLLAPLVRKGLSIASYGVALQALYEFNAPTEARIGEFISSNDIPFDYGSRRRIHALVADLSALGLAVPEIRWDGPGINSPGELVGCLYVMEGSALGGRVIFRQIADMLHIDESRGAGFFSGYGDATMQRWQEFWDFAANSCPPDAIPEACRAAANLFENIIGRLDHFPVAGGTMNG
jgi:heme oxygenase